MDRAGIAGEDGPTHHGAFDIPYMLTIPGMTVTAGKDGTETLGLLRSGVEHLSGPFSLRWPRAAVPAEVPHMGEIQAVPHGTWEVLRRGEGIALLAVGTMVLPALEAAEALTAEGINATVVNCRYLKPYDKQAFRDVLKSHSVVLTLEEGAVVNGFGAYMAREADAFLGRGEIQMDAMGIPDRFVEHGSRAELLRELALDVPGITARIRRLAQVHGLVSTARESA
jgi:1-deoxy-D-xylulose-5-phosphate synthase